MNELSDRYENYVNTMNRERAEITAANKKHVKLLVSKLLYQILDENIRKKRKNAFQEIHATATQMNNLESKLNKLLKIVCNYSEGRQRYFLRNWYRNALNCVYENYKRNNLIDANVEHRRLARFYNVWRTLYLARRKSFGGKIEASKII